MPRLLHRPPKYRMHRASGQALVTFEGRDHYLGAYGSKASRTEYDRLVGEWLANGRRAPGPAGDLTIVELLAAYWRHAETYYRKPDGTPSRELGVLRIALRPLNRLYAQTQAVQFGPLALRALSEEMIRLGWVRSSINKQLSRVRAVFRWGAANEIVPPDIHLALKAVDGLRRGRTAAKESLPVRPVPDAHVEATLPHLSRQVRAMVEMQLLTGMRPGEVCAMRGCDLDITGRLWTYRPATHKTQHHGHDRTIYIGPKAQGVLAPFLRTDLSAHLFSPADAVVEQRASRHAARKTPITQGNGPGTNRRRSPKRAAGACYDATSYRRAIARACERAFVMPAEFRPQHEDGPASREERAAKRRAWRAANVWHPHQLRHTAATRLRKEYGLEAAQVILGHKSLAVTEIYAEKNVATAVRIMGEVG